MRPLTTIRRLVVVAESILEQRLEEAFLRLGAKGYTVIECRGAGRHEILENPLSGATRIRMEIWADRAVADNILRHLRDHVSPHYGLSVSVNNIQVLRPELF